jgi:hypothetical protein
VCARNQVLWNAVQVEWIVPVAGLLAVRLNRCQIRTVIILLGVVCQCFELLNLPSTCCLSGHASPELDVVAGGRAERKNQMPGYELIEGRSSASAVSARLMRSATSGAKPRYCAGSRAFII